MKTVRPRQRLTARQLNRVTVFICALTIVRMLTVGRAQAQANPVDWVADGIGDMVGGGVSAVAKKVADTVLNGVLEFIAGLIADAVIAPNSLSSYSGSPSGCAIRDGG